MRIESRGSLGFVVGTPQSEFEAAMAMQCRGDLAAAEAAYRTLIERHGTVVGAEHMLALTLHAQGRSASPLAPGLHATAYFVKNVLLRGGFLDGPGAWRYHCEHMRYVWAKYMRLRALGSGVAR